MTEKETEGLALLEHYAADSDGRVILSGLAESIRVANAFQQTQWVPTARPMKGWTVNLRTGQIFALTLKRDEVQILLVPGILTDEERAVLEEAAHGRYEPEHPPGSVRYALHPTEARKLWGSIERAHHAALQQARHTSGATNNPEADALIDYLSRELELDLPYPDRELVSPNGKLENTPTVDDCLRILTRRPVPNGQIQLYQALWAAGSKGASTAELVSTMGRRDAKDFTGVLSALGKRINHTPGYGETQKPGIEMILRISEADKGWRYHLKPVMREALEAHAPSWLPGAATSKGTHLVDLVRSRFPGWLGFEDPRFNQGPLDEVGYKLATVRKAEELLSEEEVARLIDAGDYDEIIDRLISIGGDNNLLYASKLQIGDLKILYHDDLDRPGFCRAFIDLLYGDEDTPTRIDRYVGWVSSQGLDSMNRWALPTYFLFFLDSENEIFVKPTATRNFLKLGGWDIRFDAKPTGDDYARIRDAYAKLRDALAEYGPRHMIDLQSFGWVAQEEAERQKEAHKEAKEDERDSPIENAMKEFERTADADKLIDQAIRIEHAKRGLAETFGNATKIRSLSPETLFDFFNEVDARGGSNGIFALSVPFSKDPNKPAFQQLQKDLPTLREALTALLHGGGTGAERVDAMWEVGSGVKNYVTEGLTVASALLFIQDPEKTSGVLSMQKKEEKLRAAQHMPDVPPAATLGERFEAFEQALTELPERYGRKWTPEARKEFYFSEAFKSLENGPLPPPPPQTKSSFQDLIGSLQATGLHFSHEIVANYVLALQAKRFAILTGISGTGKTRIAADVARTFRATIRDQRTPAPKGPSASGGTAGSRWTGRSEVEGEEMLRRIAEGRIWIEKDGTRTLRSVGEMLRDRVLAPDEWKALRANGILVRADEEAIYLAYRSPLIKAQLADTILAHNWWDNLSQLPGAERGGQHRFPRWRSYTIRVPFQLVGIGEAEERSHETQIEVRPTETDVVERRLDNLVVVPVRPDWVDNRGLLGYLNPITGAYSMTPFLSLLLGAREEERRADKEGRDPHPFFVVLDEMNLARVEHYFSDFLSALESDEPIPLHDNQEIEDGAAKSGVPVPRQLWIPKNVFFTGTVNVDETTYMFSPKVLDRAFTIEFDRVDLAGYTEGVATSASGELDLSAGKDGVLRFTPYGKPDRDDWREFTGIAGGGYARILRELHAILEEEHRHFGYRVANEIARFVNLAREQSANGDEATKAAFDLALRQKVLPKFHGTQQELEPLLERLFNFALHGGERRRGDTDVSLDKWTVVNGRLKSMRGPKSAPDGSVPAGTPEAGADGPPAGGSKTEGSTTTSDADSVKAEANAEAGSASRDPEFPRTAAKLWRMLKRLEQRGFTSFIE